MAPRRVHVTGVPGSGKTTVARRIAELIGTTAHDLDEVFYEGGAGRERPRDLVAADLAAIAAQPVWVTAGGYTEQLDDLMSTADVIVLLDVPRSVALWRIVKRHVVASLRRSNRHRGIRKLLRFARYVATTYDESRRQREEALAPHREKVVRATHGRAAWIAASVVA